MNRKLKKIIQSKLSKRIISGLTAFIIIAEVFPLGEIKKEFSFLSSPISVLAADLTLDDPNTLFQHDANNALSVKIDNLVAYSKNCQLYPLYHQNDIVTIEQSDDITIGTDYYTAGFQGIGHTQYPFAGKIKIQANTIIILNLDGPLFNCVYDSVTLENINRSSAPFEISRYYGRDDISKTTALLATEVRPDPEGNAPATWNVSVTTPSSPSNQHLDQFGGIIGQMSKIDNDSAELTVSVTMNAVGTDNDSIDIKGDNNGSKDLGFACGLMEENTKLTFNYSSDRGINDISTSSGHVGGLIGYMKPGSTFSYTGANIQDDGKTIQTSSSGKYAGGIVGYNKGGTVSLSENPYPIKQVISGKGGAGGVYGYYEPTGPATIDVSKYEIDCQVNGTGNIGGLFGVLTSANSVSIIPGTSPEIIKTSHTSDATTYGGLIGYYLPIVSDSNPSDEIIPPEFSIGAVETDTERVSGTISSYGGGIGKVESFKTVDNVKKAIPAYIKFDGFTASSAGAGNLTYGGLVATADNSFIDANDVTITAADYKGGGLIGHIESGVLRLTGKTDLTNASPAFKDENIYIGQIVGYRDDSLIFSEPGWQFHRCSSSIEIDDIGSWGQVLRFSDKSTTPVAASGDTTAYNITAECYRTEIEDEDPVIETILSINELTHKITINAPSDTYLSISSIGDFAKTALCFQIDATNNLFVSFSNTDYDCSSIYSEDIVLSANVDLSGTGLTGLTRDNDVDENKKNCTYSGTYSAPGENEGEYYTVTLAIGEPYGYRSNTKITAHNGTEGAGKNYRHQYIGLFGILDGGTIQYASFAGDIYVDSNREMYVGSAVGSAKGDITVEYAETSTAIHHAGSGNLYAGTLIGQASSEIGTITVSNCTINANISGTASSKENLYLGGVVGRINFTSNTAVDSWSFSDLTIGGTISNTTGVEYNKIGGLIAGITHCSAGSSPNSRQLKLSNITLQDLDISGTAKSGSDTRTMGGLLGYSWLNVDADFDQIVIDNDCSITLTGAAENCGDLAGLVYNGTGHWTVKGDEQDDESPDAVSETEVDENDNPLYLGDIRIGNISVTSTNAKSFGMFVNKAWYSPSTNYKTDNGSSALYLDLYQSNTEYVSADVYKIDTPVFSMPSNPDNMVYDELVAYSAYYRNDGATRYTTDASGDPYVLKNGNAVISIGTNGTFKTDGENASNTYKAQTSRGLNPNPNTRYYYDLNTVIDSNPLMKWALKQYSHQSLKNNFPSTWTAITNGTYDLKNISWYPVDVDESLKINSTPTITFYNKELEISEALNGSYARTSLYDYDNDMTTQHYLMHCGLFRNVNGGTLSINTMKFRGNVGYTIKKVVSTNEGTGETTIAYESDGSGMLICGILSGKSETNKTTLTINGTNNINLEGAYVHGLSSNSYDLSTEYAPLLINKVGSNVNLTIKNIRTSSTNSGVNSYNKSSFKGTKDANGYPKAASSLIGNVGLDESASGIDLEFNNIKLDGRTIALQGDDGTKYNGQLNTAYRTERTIFTRATLLNKFQYDSGSGVYNFENAADWSSNTPPDHTSTYCVTYGKELGYTKADNAGTEYPDEERKYYGSSTIYSNPVNSNDTDGTYAAYFRNGFLPYVYTPYERENNTHQLQVNHGSTKFDGCGTYNDPYEISTADQLGTISKILHGIHTTNDEFFIYVPTVDGYYTSTADAESGIITISDIKNNAWCTDKDTSHTKFYCTNGANGYYYADVNGDGDYDDAGDMFISGDELRKYLAGAYFQIKGTATPADMTLTDSNFPYGLGASSDDFAVFRGVIDGNNKSIINQSSNALIENSYGCVVKDLDIQSVSSSSAPIRIQQDDVDTFKLSGGCKAYGEVIAKIFGGDNIIDGVTVSFASGSQICLSGTSTDKEGTSKLIPVGGYVGVIVDGGLIFRGMDSKTPEARQGLPVGIVRNGKKNDQGAILESTTAWLYVNPIIGRVMNGYAITESTAYRPFEKGYRDNADGSRTYWIEGVPVTCTAEELDADATLDATKQTLAKGVTMCNGTKNYSITDVNKNELNLLNVGAFSDSKTTVTIPNAQAMFIMSALIHSNATITPPSATPALTASDSYDGVYKTMHYADYDKINQTADVTASSITDFYNLAVNDSANLSNVPFVVKKYTSAVNDKYNILCLTNNNSSCDFILTGTDDHWYLPDGFKGIGSIGYGKTDSDYIANRTISLHKFSGKNEEDEAVKISLNMTLKHYEENGTIFKDNYFPISVTGISNDNNTSSIGGFGLFDTVRHNRTGTPADDDEICDLKISGLIDYDVIKQSGNWTYNKTNVGKYQYLNVGGIAGCMGTGADTDKDNIRIKRIDVSGLTVNGFATAGGFFGYVNMSKDDDYSVEISEISATKFTVSAKRYSGGIIGYFGKGNLEINQVEITSPNVLTYYYGVGNKDFDNGVGGIIGFVQNTATNRPVVLNDITLGSSGVKGNTRIGYKDGLTYPLNYDDVVAGGLIGRTHTAKNSSYDYTVKLTDCYLYNVDVYGHRVGGLIGGESESDGGSYIAIYDSHVICDQSTTAVVYGVTKSAKDRACAGLIGAIWSNSFLVVDTCSVEGYKLQGLNDTAGVCANAQKAGGGITVRNFKISDVKIQSDYSASLFGYLFMDLNGYNILVDNVQFIQANGNATTTGTKDTIGFLVAKNNGKTIKIAGFSRKNEETIATGYYVPQNMLGTTAASNSKNYGSNGYVIFADYNNAAEAKSGTFKQEITFSNVNDSNNVKDYNNETVSDNFPYVSSSPKMAIDAPNNNTPIKYLSGDMMTAYGLNGSALESIINDISSTQAPIGYYDQPKLTATQMATVKSHISSTADEFNVVGLPNFPLLIVDDTDYEKTTELINNCLWLLTNTGDKRYNSTTDASKTQNWAANVSGVYDVNLYTYQFNANTKTFSQVGKENSSAVCLRKETMNNKAYFRMYANNVDTKSDGTVQFTLMDVQFKDPSSSGKIAYHLYVPIYVKKILQYNFRATLASNTDYIRSIYTTNRSNTLFENIGNPLTMEFEFEYTRTTDEWKAAINGGDSVMTNYYKSLYVDNHMGNWPSDAKMVLVDANNNDKVYYNDSGIAATSGRLQLDLESFNGYTPAPLNNIMTITVKDGSGNLRRCSEPEATVRDKDGYYYKYDPSGSGTKYEVIDVTIQPEIYYLSIFTRKDESDTNIYHYTFYSKDKFDKHNDSDTLWRPNKIASTSPRVNLYMGNLYDNDIRINVESQTGSDVMGSGNLYLDISLTAQVSLKRNAVDNYIPDNMKDGSYIYQTFLMTYDMKETTDGQSIIGIQNKNAVNIAPDYRHYYFAEGKHLTDFNASSAIELSTDEYRKSDNNIELRNRLNLVPYLKLSSNEYAATLQSNFRLVYDTQTLNDQFPKRININDDVGSKVIGYSNISSSEENAAFSSTYKKGENGTRYYISDPLTADLQYNVVETPNEIPGKYSYLGINAVEEGNKAVFVDTYARYDTSMLKDSNSYDYIEFSLQLSNKENYARPLKISDYLTGLKIYGQNNVIIFDQDKIIEGTDSAIANVSTSISQDGKTYKVRIKKSLLQTQTKDDETEATVFVVPIKFNVYTGDNKFNDDTKTEEGNEILTGLMYSNYKVSLHAEMYSGLTGGTSYDVSQDADHLIYTNTKVIPDVIQ